MRFRWHCRPRKYGNPLLPLAPRMTFRPIFAVLVITLSFADTNAASTAPNIVAKWDFASLQGIREAKLGAPVVARALAIVHTCMYDAWAAYDERAHRNTTCGRAPPSRL